MSLLAFTNYFSLNSIYIKVLNILFVYLSITSLTMYLLAYSRIYLSIDLPDLTFLSI